MGKMILKMLTTNWPVRVITLVMVTILMVSCSSKRDENGIAYTKLVKTARATPISAEKQKQFAGIIEEAEEVNLAFRVAGSILKIHVIEGEYVKKGQLIAEMDTRDYEVQRNAIKAQVSQLQSEYSRVKELKNRKSVAVNDYEKMKAGKEMAEAKLKNAADQLNDTKLHAPFTGYITKVMFENGELVNHGTPIASIIDVSMLKVEINVPASVYINKSKITKIECTQENIPGTTFPLTLYANNIKANNNGLYKFYLYHKPATHSKLAPGMNVSVQIFCTTLNEALISIPLSAIFRKEEKNFVWVINDSSVSSREIETTSMIENGNIGVSKGLSENEQVVVGGLNLLSENETVKVIPAVSKSNIGEIL